MPVLKVDSEKAGTKIEFRGGIYLPTAAPARRSRGEHARPRLGGLNATRIQFARSHQAPDLLGCLEAAINEPHAFPDVSLDHPLATGHPLPRVLLPFGCYEEVAQSHQAPSLAGGQKPKVDPTHALFDVLVDDPLTEAEPLLKGFLVVGACAKGGTRQWPSDSPQRTLAGLGLARIDGCGGNKTALTGEYAILANCSGRYSSYNSARGARRGGKGKSACQNQVSLREALTEKETQFFSF